MAARLYANTCMQHRFVGKGTGGKTETRTMPNDELRQKGLELLEKLHGGHVDAAAEAALLSIDRARPGTIFNVAEGSQALSSEKAIRELGWDPHFRIVSAGEDQLQAG